MNARRGYSIPLSELSTGGVYLPGGLAASPRLVRDERRGMLHVWHDVTPAARAAYDQMPSPMRRPARDQGAGMRRPARDQDPPDNMGTRGASGPDERLARIVEFLRGKLAPKDFEQLVAMANGQGGRNGDGDYTDVDFPDDAGVAQDEKRFHETYPNAHRLKWAV